MNEKLTKDRAKAHVEQTKNRAKASLQRGKRSIFSRIAKIVFHRAFFVSLAIALQLAVLAVAVTVFLRHFALFYLFYAIIATAAVLKIISGRYEAAYKIAWIVPVLAVPVFGGLMYLLYGGNKLSKRDKKQLLQQNQCVQRNMGPPQRTTLEYLAEQGGDAITQSRYIHSASCCPPHLHTETEYYPLGDDVFVAMKQALEQAEKFIFVHFFIIRPGKMWNEILEILERKAAEGLDVRVIYDDVGCLYTLPGNYDKILQKKGIACEVFNRYRPVVSLRLNNRDHRKMLIIDGKIGFTGGINLADEYINEEVRFGHWKDSGIRLHGEGVWNMTVSFLATWAYLTGKEDDFEAFRPRVSPLEIATDGVVQFFEDSPLDDKPVGANAYHNMIAKANRYIYFTTPYLIVDDAMTNSLCAAAQAGVDVRIITPHIPDKKIVFQLTRAHYQILLESGVRIYEYTPGFIHAKNFVVDDTYATVGTINMDYRSLYLHFECGVWMANSSAVRRVREDFMKTLEVCEEISLEDAKRFSRRRRFLNAFLRAFAPLF
jgi:cardiolipin synthase A/B